MSKNRRYYDDRDLYESGKAYQSSFFGQGDSTNPSQVNHPYGTGSPSDAPQDYGGGNMNPNLPVPVESNEPSQSNSLLSKIPIKEISGFVDRMGGVEGIMNMINKTNTLLKNVQQMAPMIKLLAGSFGSKASTANSQQYAERKRKRRRRRRKKSTYSSTGSKKKLSTSKKKKSRRRY